MGSEAGAGSELTGMIEGSSPVLGSEDGFGSPMSSPRRHSTRVRIAQRFLCFVLCVCVRFCVSADSTDTCVAAPAVCVSLWLAGTKRRRMRGGR